MTKYLSILFFGSIAFIAQAQVSNVFLERSYWKKNPTIDQIKIDIAAGNSINAMNKYDFDPVSWALIEKVDNNTVKFLLSQDGNEVNKLTHDERTYIFWAAYRGNLKMMRFLVDQGAKTDIIDEHGYSLLTFSAVTGQNNTEVYDFCLSHGANIQEKNKDGANSLLLVLPHLKKHETISYFLNKGLSLTSTDDFDNNAFVYAAQKGNQDILEYLIAQGIEPNCNNGMATLFAAKGYRGHTNDVEVYHFLKNIGVDLNAKNKSGENALNIIGKKSQDLEVFTFLISNGLDLNNQDDLGYSPIANAVKYNTTEVVNYLIESNANVNLRTENGNNLLHVAVESFNEDMIEFICQKFPSEINAYNRDGLTPLHLAAMKAKDDKIIRLLIRNGANKDLKSSFDESVYELVLENELLMESKVELEYLK